MRAGEMAVAVRTHVPELTTDASAWPPCNGANGVASPHASTNMAKPRDGTARSIAFIIRGLYRAVCMTPSVFEKQRCAYSKERTDSRQLRDGGGACSRGCE